MPHQNDQQQPTEGVLISEYEVFARLPEWVLDAAISDRAVRLFAVLLRHADKGGKAFPSRARIAARLRCSTDSVDRAIKELVVLGALNVERQGGKPGEAFRSNVYRLLKQPAPSRVGAATPGREVATIPGRTAAESLAAPLPNERESPNESHVQTPPPSEGPPATKKGTRIPADFTVTEGMRAWAVEHLSPHPLDLDFETAAFVDHFTAATGRVATKRDWVAAWRNWMRESVRRAGRGQSTQPDVLAAYLDRVGGDQ